MITYLRFQPRWAILKLRNLMIHTAAEPFLSRIPPLEILGRGECAFYDYFTVSRDFAQE